MPKQITQEVTFDIPSEEDFVGLYPEVIKPMVDQIMESDLLAMDKIRLLDNLRVENILASTPLNLVRIQLANLKKR